MLRKDSKMNLAVVRPAVKLANKQTVEELVVMLVSRVKCTLQFVLAVEYKLKYLFNHPVTNLSIVANVIKHHAVTRIGNTKSQVIPCDFFVRQTGD
jgi:hypothetical protein